MTVLSFVAAIAAALALLFVVGVPLTWAVGLRGLGRVAFAPVFALTMIGGAAIVAPWVGLTWSVLPVIVITVVVGAVIVLARRRWGSAVASPGLRWDWWLFASLVAAAGLLSFRVVQIIASPEHISQTFDNIFHLNAVRYALDTGNASSLHLGSMTSPSGSLAFYPGAWHAFVSLIVQVSGASIAVSINAVSLVVAAVVWPIGIVYFVRTLAGTKPALTVATALIATAVPAFPLMLIDYGVLYPLQLGFALLPPTLAAAAVLMGVVKAEAPVGAGWWALILVGAIPGMTLAHPGALVAWLALTVPIAIWFAWTRLVRATTAGRRVLVVAGFGAYLVVGLFALRALRPPLEARGWPIEMSVLEALWQVASGSFWYHLATVAVTVAVLVGIVWAIVDRGRISLLFLAMYGVGAVLFIAVASLPWLDLRDLLTGAWYNNTPRLAAILAITMVPLGAYGVARTWDAVRALPRLKARSDALSVAGRVSVGVLCAVVFGAVLQVGAVQRAVEWGAGAYGFTEESPLLSPDEAALLARVGDIVPEGVAIAGSPWTGTGLAYAMADRPVLMPHTLMEMSDAINDINDGLSDAERGDASCQALAELGVGFVLDFGKREVHGAEHIFPGLEDLDTSDAVRLVDEEGDARLYEIVACGTQ